MMLLKKESLLSLSRTWQKFWFEYDQPRAFRLYRAALGLLLFGFYSIRALDLRWLFSQTGFLSLDAVREVVPMEFRYSIFQLFPGDLALQVGNGIFLISLLCLAFGFRARVFSLIALALHLSFIHRNLAIVYGIDLIAGYLLFYLALAQTLELRSVAMRLTQIQICVIYAYSGWEKLKGASWWSGEALWAVLANSQLARFDFTPVSHFPLLVAIATGLTLLWEIYFPVLIWTQNFRKPMLIFGILFHIGIALTINITFFAGIMIVSYLSYITDRDIPLNLKFIRSGS